MDENRCKKVIKHVEHSEYEHKDRYLKQKWEETFRELERPPKPLDRRSSLVSKLLPLDVYERLAPIIKLKCKTYGLNSEFQITESKVGEPIKNVPYIREGVSKVKKEKESDEEDEDEEVIDSVDFDEVEEVDGEELKSESTQETISLSSGLFVNPPSSREEKVEEEIEPNPYIKFLEKPEIRAAVWRPKDILVIPPGTPIQEAMPLLVDPKRTLKEKSDAVTNSIVKEFCGWLQDLGGVEKSKITEDVMLQLFEIGFDAPAAKSLCVRVKELPVVPESAALARNLPQAAIRAGLLREIHWDARAEKKPAKLIAFGRGLPIRPPLRFKPANNHTRERWLESTILHEDLLTMKCVWDGITTLRSTSAYCNWLLEHPKVPPPIYLVKEGIMDLAAAKAQAPDSEQSSINDFIARDEIEIKSSNM